MFEIGFSELLLVALVALLVFGPERLPTAVRTGSLWLGRLKRSFQSIKQEIEREIGADEIRRQLHNEDILQMERELKKSVQQALTPPPISGQPAAPDEPPASAVPAGSSEPPSTAAQDSEPPSSASTASEPPRQP